MKDSKVIYDDKNNLINDSFENIKKEKILKKKSLKKFNSIEIIENPNENKYKIDNSNKFIKQCTTILSKKSKYERPGL